MSGHAQAPVRAASMVDRLWRPEMGPQPIMVRWMLSEWCNYRCPYCPQTHDRRAPKGNGFTAHGFDNHSVQRWLEAFERHFSSRLLVLVMTGGEPMLDRRAMTLLINTLSAAPWVASLRIDTNAWWRADQFPDLDTRKLILMCTFHPSQTNLDDFLTNLRTYRAAGIEIGMVNYVMDAANVPAFETLRQTFAAEGVVLAPNPLWTGTGTYSAEADDLLRRYLPALDYTFRAGASPHGRSCRFPGISYEMDFTGRIHPGCFPRQAGLFFDETLPALPLPVTACPAKGCACLDKYSFLDGCERNVSLTPLRQYAEALAAQAEAPPNPL